MPLHSHVEGKGRPVVVLPSLSLDSTAMRAAFEPAFAGLSGWARIYLDLPGSGGSPPGEPTSDAAIGNGSPSSRASTVAITSPSTASDAGSPGGDPPVPGRSR